MIFIDMGVKINFNQTEKQEILDLYRKGMGATKIGEKFDISKTPILKLLKEYGVVRTIEATKKIELSNTQKNKIKKLYLENNKNTQEIANEMNLTKSYIDKYLAKCDYRRSKSEAMRIYKTGKKLPNKTIEKLKKIQQNLSKSGKRKQTGGVCKFFYVEGLKCQGTYEKYYIEKLLKDKKTLPKNCESIVTPYGTYYPDFKYKEYLVEIKCDYTYKVMMGELQNRFTGVYDTKQLKKIKWVSENIKPVKVIVVDKRKHKLIEKNI